MDSVEYLVRRGNIEDGVESAGNDMAHIVNITCEQEILDIEKGPRDPRGFPIPHLSKPSYMTGGRGASIFASRRVTS